VCTENGEIEEVEEVKDEQILPVRKGSRGFGRANIGDDSMQLDCCQGNSTIILSFERETGKWSGWKGLAGIWEFGETGYVRYAHRSQSFRSHVLPTQFSWRLWGLPVELFWRGEYI
jgi:hypothetical protein